MYSINSTVYTELLLKQSNKVSLELSKVRVPRYSVLYTMLDPFSVVILNPLIFVRNVNR